MTNLIRLMKPHREGMKWTQGAAQFWLREHYIDFMSFLESNYTFESIKDAKEKYFTKDPYLGVQKTIDFMTANNIKERVLKYMLSKLEFGQILFLFQS